MSTQWVNAGPDEAALPALLGRIAERIPVDAIDELWIFPTRRGQGVESTVIVVSTFDGASPAPSEPDSGPAADPPDRNASLQRAEVGRRGRVGQGERSLSPAHGEGGQGEGGAWARDRRRINTAHFTATRDRKGRATLDEKIELHAIAPADAAGRVVEGVIRRLDDGLALPRSERIAGDADRWMALVEALGAPPTPPLTQQAEASDPWPK